jgi:hypothetical protein
MRHRAFQRVRRVDGRTARSVASQRRKRSRLGRGDHRSVHVASSVLPYPTGRHATSISGERDHLERRQTTRDFLRLAAQAGRSEHVQRPLTLRSKPRTPIRPHRPQRRKTGSDITSRISLPAPSVGSSNAAVMRIGHPRKLSIPQRDRPEMRSTSTRAGPARPSAGASPSCSPSRPSSGPSRRSPACRCST